MLGIAGASLLGSHEASAQNALDNSTPSDGETVNTSPEQILLEFAEPVGTNNRVDASCNSNPVAGLTQPSPSDDNRTLTVTVLQPLPQGTCVVVWQVSEPSGAPGATGRFTFDVASAPTTTEAEGTSPAASTPTTEAAGSGDESSGGDDSTDLTPVADIGTYDAGFPLWIGRVLSILGLSVLFGSLLLLAVAWPEGPEYVIAVRFIRSAWIVGLIGTIVYVAAATASATGESFGSSLNPVEWADLLDADWPGRAALARLLLAVAAGWVAFLPERAVEPSTQFPALVIPGLAVATFGLTRTGGDLAALGVAMGLLHAVAMAIWLGGVIFVSRIVLAGSGEEDLVHATRGFNRLAIPALGITVVTGLVQLFRLDGGELFEDSHGKVLLLKSVVVAAVVFIAMSVHQVVQARLSHARSLDAAMANRLRRAFGVDALLGVIVIGLTAWMLEFPPPNVEADNGSVPNEVVETIKDERSGIDMEVILTPGRVGPNKLVVKVFEPEEDLRGLEVTFVPPANGKVGAITQAIPLNGRGMAYMVENDAINFAVAGAWTLEVSASTADGSITKAGGAFQIRRKNGQVVEPGNTGTTTTTSTTQARRTTDDRRVDRDDRR